MVRIMTNSTCDLTQDLVEKHHITVVLMYINV